MWHLVCDLSTCVSFYWLQCRHVFAIVTVKIKNNIKTTVWAKQSLMQFHHPSFFAVQRPDEEEEDCWEWQSKNPADHQGVGPEEEPGSKPGVAEGLIPCLPV